MGKPQRRFGKEFAAEAVRLVEVSGRTQREIATGDPSASRLSTLAGRWLDKRREHEIDSAAARTAGGPPAAELEAVAARENERSCGRNARSSGREPKRHFFASEVEVDERGIPCVSSMLWRRR